MLHLFKPNFKSFLLFVIVELWYDDKKETIEFDLALRIWKANIPEVIDGKKDFFTYFEKKRKFK
jgi:hypothetical protein